MAIIKCKMCGGTIEFEPGATVGVCDSCGTKQTLPRLDDDRRANLYDRANHFRRNNDFDKAAGIYEQILNEDGTDAEAYWSLVLCRYGIEYVEDPASHKRVPTVNRAQYTSIYADEDYKAAIAHADTAQRAVYEAEAAAIDGIQKGILEISKKEEPFDVFICYKETDANGRRTPDSVLANDLYHQLAQEGFKVFFARITLEDKLGQEYEPYIFAALNSAKVMVVLGTKPEYFNAVWVKNEWSRYLGLIKAGAKKTLIPAYRDMDPYDLPEEFSHLQAQDMSKLGFMQDLIRGIQKLTDDGKKAEPRQNLAASEGSANIRALIDRGTLALEDGEWEKAQEFFDRALDLDARCAEAYVGLLMTDLKVRRRADLAEREWPFDVNSNYKKALRFSDADLKAELEGYIFTITDRKRRQDEAKKQARMSGAYGTAVRFMARAKTEADFINAAKAFELLEDYSDAPQRVQECLKKAEDCRAKEEENRKEEVYRSACALAMGKDSQSLVEALKLFRSIPGWKNADECAAAIPAKYSVMKAEEERIDVELKAMQVQQRDEKLKRIRIKKIRTWILYALVAAAFIGICILLYHTT